MARKRVWEVDVDALLEDAKQMTPEAFGCYMMMLLLGRRSEQPVRKFVRISKHESQAANDYADGELKITPYRFEKHIKPQLAPFFDADGHDRYGLARTVDTEQ